MSKDDALAVQLRALYAEVVALWGFTIPEGPLDGVHAAALEAMMRAVKEDRESAATRLEALQGQPVGEAFVARIGNRPMAQIDGVDELLRLINGGAKFAEIYRGQRIDNVDSHVAALTASPPVVEREALREIINRRVCGFVGEYENDREELIDAILALTPVEGVGMREGLTDADIFDMGYAWQQMLTGQTLEDARAVGRTLGCDLFQPIAEHIDAAEKEMGFNPFQTSDLGIVQAKAIIKAAIARHRARSTPAAQEDEVREAQPVCDSCGTEWFSTDSKCHLCRRGEMTLATLTKGARDAG